MEELKEILNHCLNNALIGQNRIKQNPSSNDIAGFVNDWQENGNLDGVNLVSKKLLLRSYKEGFDSALNSLIAANEAIQKMEL